MRIADNGLAHPTLTIDITVADESWQKLDSQNLVNRALQTAWAHIPDRPGTEVPLIGAEVSVYLTDDAEIQALNVRYRQQDKPTNVLSFPADTVGLQPLDSPLFLGDIVLARETLLQEAGETGKNPKDHLTHLVVHGLLHLMGYDHEHDTEAAHMEDLEVRILRTLDIPDPYQDAASEKKDRPTG